MVAICLIMVYHHIEPKSIFVSFLLYDGEIRTQLGLLFFCIEMYRFCFVVKI